MHCSGVLYKIRAHIRCIEDMKYERQIIISFKRFQVHNLRSFVIGNLARVRVQKQTWQILIRWEKGITLS